MDLLNGVREAIYGLNRSGKISREQIDKPIRDYYGISSIAHKKIMLACDGSRDTHLRSKKGGIKERKNGDRLIDHERSMFLIAFVHLGIRNINLLIAIFLHDMFEDHPKEWSLKRIREEFGDVVAKLVQAVSKPPRRDMSIAQFDKAIFRRVSRGGKWAMILKCIDRLHNMITLYGDRDKIVWKVHQTIEYVFGIASQTNTLVVELLQATAEQIDNHNITNAELAQVA